MELDIIKQQTTWNDAATGINSNFAKVKQAIQLLEGMDKGLDEESLISFLEENGYATEAYVATQISSIMGGASSAYDTLKEIEDILEGNINSIADLLAAIDAKASKDELTAIDEKYAELIEALTAKDTEHDEKLEALADKSEMEALAQRVETNEANIQAIDERVTKNETDISDHNDRLEALEDKDDMFHWVTDADGTRRIETDYDLASLRTVASGGKGQQGSTSGVGGGIMAVKVNGQTISDDDDDKIIELPDYYTAEQSQAIEDRVSAVELNLDDKVSAEDLAPIATSGNYEDLENKPTFKTVNGESIEGEGDIVIEANESAGSYIIHFPLSSEDTTLTEEQLAVNREAYEAYINAPSEKKPVLFSSMGNVLLVDADFDSENGGLYLFHEFSMPVNLGSYTQLLYFGEEALLYSDGSLADYYMSTLEIPTTDALKTINGETIVGTGNIVIEGGGVDSEELESMLATKQDTIEDLEDIRSGASAGATALQEVPPEYITETELEEALEGKMDNVTLAKVATSGSYNDLTDTPTFKTINGESIVGEGNITIEGGGSELTIDEAMSDVSENAVQNKVIKAYADGVASDAETNAKAYTDEVVGAINTLLDTINGEAI